MSSTDTTMAESTTLQEASIFASYQPAESTFELPQETFIISDPIAKYKSDHVPYKLIGDNPELEASKNPVKVTHIDIFPPLSKAGVRGLVTNVSHGTFDSRPASLIVFSFSLRSGGHAFRFQNANVKIEFAKHPAAKAQDVNPAIIKFAPRKVYGLPTVEHKKNRVGGEFTLQVPAGPLTIGPTASFERESEFEKEYRFKTQGNFWSSKNGTNWDIVYWDMKENRRTNGGIPDMLNVAVVVEREGPFVATVEVTVDTPVVNGAFSYPWTKNNPATFVPGVVMGKQPRTGRFEELSDEDWRALIPYEDEWEGKFVEVALNHGKGREALASSSSEPQPSGGDIETVEFVVDV